MPSCLFAVEMLEAVFVEFAVFLDSNSKVSSATHMVKQTTIQSIVRCLHLWIKGYDFVFGNVEGHPQSLGPVTECIQVMLENHS